MSRFQMVKAGREQGYVMSYIKRIQKVGNQLYQVQQIHCCSHVQHQMDQIHFQTEMLTQKDHSFYAMYS